MATPIAYVLKMYPRLSETFILNEILELERQGVDVHIYSLRPSDDRRSHADVMRVRAPVTLVPRTAWPPSATTAGAHLGVLARHPVRYLRRLREALRHRDRSAVERFGQAVVIADGLHRSGVRHVHAHFATTAASVALEVEHLTGVGFSLTAHAKDIFSDDVNRSELVRKLRAARFVVTVSDFNVGWLAEQAPDSRVVRIYNGLDLDRFTVREATTPAAVPLVLAVGRLVEKKGFADLVAAAGLLLGRGCRFRCVIVGGGNQEASIREQIASLGARDLVTLTGPLPREDVLALYREATVLVAPCVVGSDGNRDGLPTVLIEAMALGVPVVSTAVTGIPELVRDGETGLVVGEHDPERLADAIEEVLCDPAAAARRAVAARDLIERWFDLGRNAAELRRRFEEAAA